MASDEEIEELIDDTFDEDDTPANRNNVSILDAEQESTKPENRENEDTPENKPENKSENTPENTPEVTDHHKNDETLIPEPKEVKNGVDDEGKNDDEKDKEEKMDVKETDDKERSSEKQPEAEVIQENGSNEISKEGEEKVEEEEEEETEMTEEEKEDMYNAVREGDFMLFQDLLDKKNADLNMKWYNENLLMVALKAGQTFLAEFLIDIGIDYNYTTSILELKSKEKTGKRLYCYKLSCRQLAQDLGYLDIVELIDVNNGNIFKYYKPRERTVMERRPPPPPTPEEEELDEEEFNDNECVTENDEGGLSDVKSSLRVRTKEDGNTEDDADNLSIRDKTESEQDMTTEKMTEFECVDDGYGSMTPRSSFYCASKQEIKEQRPPLIKRDTKSSVGLRTFNMMKYHRRLSKSAHVPRIVNAVGSYAQESKLWHIDKPLKPKDDESAKSVDLPFLARVSLSHQSQKKIESRRRTRPLSSTSSPSTLSHVTTVFKQSRLQSPKPQPGLPYIRQTQTSRVRPFTASHTITPWCHNNSSGVFQRLSDMKIQNSIKDKKFHVNRQLFLRRSLSYTR